MSEDEMHGRVVSLYWRLKLIFRIGCGRGREFFNAVAVVGLVLAVTIICSAPAQAARQKPNILYIMTDQQPISCVAAYGNRIIKTPHLDKLAEAGCTFHSSYIAAFPCSPSRATQLSGRYAHNHGVVENDVLFDQKIPCLGDVCKAAGYDTGYFGKWHLGGYMYRCREASRPKNVDGKWFWQRVQNTENYEFEAVPGGLGEDGSQHGFETWIGGWKHYRAYLQKVGFGETIEKRPRTGCHIDAPSGPDRKHIYSLFPEEHHVASFLAQNAEQFIRERGEKSRPWCAVLSFYGPHHPVAPPRPWDMMYTLDQITLPANHYDTLKGKPVSQRNESSCYVLPRWNEGQFKDYIRRYWGYCSYIDKQIGRVLTALRETDQWNDTIILFTSDHGDMVGAHGMIFKLGYCGYEELYRVPTILYVPGMTKPGSRSDALVSNVDFLPTLLEASGIPVPDGIDGKSMLPLVRGQTTHHREIIFADCFNRALICRDKRYKFVLNWNKRDLDELYDLEADPGELKNLAYVSRHTELAAGMRRQVLDWLRETKHPYVTIISREAAKQPHEYKENSE
ncbi:MAG: sulfatase-like hydrolase/transferase [Planctomycetota bacterium]|nr:MAG: sulfatase-like hydrolase/transferase [Planctomycetota bacterium]